MEMEGDGGGGEAVECRVEEVSFTFRFLDGVERDKKEPWILEDTCQTGVYTQIY